MKKIFYIILLTCISIYAHSQGKKGKNTNNTPSPQNSEQKAAVKDIELIESTTPVIFSLEKVEYNDLQTALSNPELVTSLRLNKQGLTEIPIEISKFVNLIELDLSDNEITDFTSKLNSLTKLQTLNISGNKLTTVPTDICNLKNLKTLNLSRNKISSGSFTCLNSLERLYLNNNELTTLPLGITDIKTLKALFLHSNNLTTLDENLTNLNKLEVLFVQFNKIEIEPLAFKHNLILKYVFTPQNISATQLYKYYLDQKLNVQITQTSINEDTKINSLPENITSNNKNLKKKGQTKNYVAIRAMFGFGSEYFPEIFDYPYYALNYEVEYCFKNNAVGIIFALKPNSEVEFDYGVYYKKHFKPTDSKFRPYVKLGLVNDLDRMGVIAKAGFDYFYRKKQGFYTEIGIDRNAYIGLGFIFRPFY